MKTHTEQELREALAALAPADAAPVDMWPRLRSRLARRRRLQLSVCAVGVAAVASLALVRWPGSGDDVVAPNHGAKSAVEVTLGLRGTPSQGMTAEILDVLRRRIDGLGIGGATIEVRDDRYFVVTAPSADLEQFGGLADGGHLQLRQVLKIAPAPDNAADVSVGTAADLNHAKSVFARSTCSEPAGRPRSRPLTPLPARYLVACSLDNDAKYLLGPSSIQAGDVASADAQRESNGEWVVTVSLTQAGAAGWKTLTQTAAAQPPMTRCELPSGCNGIGIVVDGRIISVPSVEGGTGLNGGMVSIPVGSRAEARALAVDVSHPLSVDLDYVSTRTDR